MNKKFSTLVASLLVSSTFGVYNVGAVPVLANQTQIETRAVAADVEEAQIVTSLPAIASVQGASGADATILPGFTNNARLYVIENASTVATNQYVRYNSGVTNVDAYSRTTQAAINSYYWTFIDGQLINNANQVMSIQGRDHFEIIPVETTSGAGSRFFVLGTRDSNGQLFYVTFDASASTDLKFRAGSETNINNAAIFCSVETYFERATAKTAVELNEELGNGFNLSISSLINEDAAVDGASVFAGVLTAMVDKNTVAEGSADLSYNYMLRNADGNFVVFEKGGVSPSDQNAQKGTFKLVSKDDVDSYIGDKGYNKFNIYAADNGSKDVIVKIYDCPASGTNSLNYRLYIASTGSTFALSVEDQDYTGPIDAINYAVTSMVADNYVNLKQFLTGQFVNVDFVGAPVIDGTNRYKVGGTLVTKGGDNYDFVAKSSVYEKAPEAQWAVAYDETTGNITLVNRENPETETNAISALRSTTTPNVYEVVTTNGALVAGDLIKITFVEDHSKYDGYARFDATELRNKTYHLGQVRQAEGEAEVNVYWAENHGTHQIGATVEEANASKWNLSFVNKAIKDHESEVDSVLIVSNLATWNPIKSRADVKADTLVILPYAFQNRSNNEFVRMNDETNLFYYICDKDNKDNDVDIVYQADGETEAYRWRPAQRFALKMKADGTYNYIALASKNIEDDDNPVYSNKGGVVVDDYGRSEEIFDKVYQENSTDRGTWRDMNAYAGDANALMFVTEVTAPEYRKLVTTEALDTIKLYRGDNEAQVVYEKRNDDAVVDGRTLSFLNIDNDTQFTDINPALYADTAYVNRGNNTRWQYLLGVNIEHVDGYYCPTHGFAVTPPCEHAKPVSYNTGRYLINMIDTANVYGEDVNIHNNPYINETEEGMNCAKLSFVDAIHVLTDPMDETAADKLYVINGTEEGDTVAIDLSTPDFNIAKFAFKYMDSMNSDEFKIQTLWKQYAPGTKEADLETSQEGYLRWVNGCIVVDKTFQKGDVFNMDENETRTPTANEEISAEAGAVSVVATDGAIIVKGAEGKNVVVATILGKVVANEVATSDNETIAVPAGIAVVAVDGESFKVVVK